MKELLADVTPLRRSPGFRRLFVGQCLTMVGSQVTQVAVPWQVYSVSHSSVALGMVGLAALLPIVVFGIYGGAIADSMDRRRLILITSSGSAAVSVALVVQAVAHADSLWLLYTCVTVQAAFFAIDLPTRRALLPRLVEPEDLPAANALLLLVFTVGIVGGPLAAGATVSLGGYGAAYAVDVACFVLAITFIAGLPAVLPEGGGRRADLSSVLEGIRYLKSRPVLWMCYVLDLNSTVFAMPTALFPVLAVERFHGGPELAGYLSAALASGAFLGSMFGGWMPKVRRLGRAALLAVLAWGVSLGALGLAGSLWLAMLLLAVAGYADTVSAVERSSILQHETPDELRGRTSGVLTVVGAGGPRLGDVRAGLVAAACGPAVAAVAGGVACVVGALALAKAVPEFTRYRMAEEAAGAGEAAAGTVPADPAARTAPADPAAGTAPATPPSAAAQPGGTKRSEPDGSGQATAARSSATP
ncbi:MFS transporter [Kitasatospora sp. NPDC059599]|uniref:MFS transporter n=1 Tax=Kitasatospora sp. NPDC059599 TaxID=3346880 RepID=UPI0036BECD08